VSFILTIYVADSKIYNHAHKNLVTVERFHVDVFKIYSSSNIANSKTCYMHS